MRNSERKHFYDEIDMLKKKVSELKEELLEIYKCLYPNNEDIVEQIGKEAGLTPAGLKFLREWDFLNIMRDYHKKQLEKAEFKKMLQECMGEIKE